MATMQADGIDKVALMGHSTGGLHDLILSEKGVRDGVYECVFDFLRKNGI